jgi:hypothetical protein
LVISDRYQRHRGKILSPVLLTPVINCIDDRGLLLLQNYPRPQKSATAADIVIGTAMKTRKGTFWRPQGPLIKMCGVFLDATFHGGSNDTIGDLSPSTFSFPWQLPTSMASLFL